jgi:hypothetical protein
MNKLGYRGLSMLEITFSLGILAMIMLPVFMTFSSGNRNMQLTEAEFRAHTAALELMEQLVSLPFRLVPAGNYPAAAVVDKAPLGNSGIFFRLTEADGLTRELQIEDIKRGKKVVFKKIIVKIGYPAAKKSDRRREFVLKTLVANENI